MSQLGKLTINNVVPNEALQKNTDKSHKPVLHVFILRKKVESRDVNYGGRGGSNSIVIL